MVALNRSPESFDQINPTLHTRAIILSILVEDHWMMLHAIYESFSPEDLGQEDFERFPSLSLCEFQNKQNRANFHDRAII